jgi:hypothetical protein
MGLTFAEAIHITHGDSAAAGLRALGALRVLVRRDLLTVGRCDVDPALHRQARMEQWHIDAEAADGGLLGDELVDALRMMGAGPVVLWTSPAWSDRCHTWCLLDVLARRGVGRDRLFRAQAVADDPARSLGAVPGTRLQAALVESVPLPADFADEGVALWKAFAAPTPLPFDEARRRGSPAYPELLRIGAGHIGWFPWAEPDRLRLADADAALLGALADDWRPGADLLDVPIVQPVLAWIGDYSLFARLAAWRDHGAVEVRGEGVEQELRLTPIGRRLVDDGAESVDQMAPLWIGGSLVNDPGSPWVRIGDPDGSSHLMSFEITARQ